MECNYFLTKSFEFGEFFGLDLIEGTVEKITNQTTEKIKTPHIGWSEIHFKNENQLFSKFDKKASTLFTLIFQNQK